MKMIEAIQEKCQREGWYGPADFKWTKAALVGTPSFRWGFVYPPATPEQLQETEQILGFPLPPLLKMLYLQLANGGFGPGAGLRGAIGGYGEPGTFENGNDETLIKCHRWGSPALIDLPTSQKVLLPSDVWPHQLAPLCDLGCDVEVCIDANGQLYRLGSAAEYAMCSLSRWITLEQWLQQWLAQGTSDDC